MFFTIILIAIGLLIAFLSIGVLAISPYILLAYIGYKLTKWAIAKHKSNKQPKNDTIEILSTTTDGTYYRSN